MNDPPVSNLLRSLEIYFSCWILLPVHCNLWVTPPDQKYELHDLFCRPHTLGRETWRGKVKKEEMTTSPNTAAKRRTYYHISQHYRNHRQFPLTPRSNIKLSELSLYKQQLLIPVTIIHTVIKWRTNRRKIIPDITTLRTNLREQFTTKITTIVKKKLVQRRTNEVRNRRVIKPTTINFQACEIRVWWK